jgi:hypothetical protein
MFVAVVLIAWRSRRSLRDVVIDPVPATVASAVVVVLYTSVFVVWAWR